MITGGALLAAGVGTGIVFATRPESVTSAVTRQPAAAPAPQRSFVSSDLTVPAVTSWKTGTTAAGLLFVTQQVKGFNGLIMEESGEPVWIEPTKKNLTDLRVQTYQGKPVLTYWSGTSSGGMGAGKGTILDTAYVRVATVTAGGDFDADLHEFKLTDRGTALITVYAVVKADLSPIGGAKAAYVYDCRVQEIDIGTERLLLDWSALEHVPLSETYFGLKQDPGHDGTTRGRAFDAYHLNSVEDDGDRLLVSARHTHAIYAIDRISGDVRWRFGGKKSDIAVAENAAFAWQHDARRHPDGTITLFDNHLSAGADGESRGLKFALSADESRASLVQTFTYDEHLGVAMGSMQALPNGNVLVGWGTDPALTEFTPAGKPVFEAALGGICYRSLRCEWTAHPATAPDVAVRPEGDGLRVFASWNGATEVSSWRMLASQSQGSGMTDAGEVERSGFETSLLVPSAARVAVQALDADGQILGASKTIAA
jgi:hypothetical protein